MHTLLQMAREEPLLRFVGFMGHDAYTHIAGARERAHMQALASYQRFVEALRTNPLPLADLESAV